MPDCLSHPPRCTQEGYELAAPATLAQLLPVPAATAELVSRTRQAIRDIMTGMDPRLLIVVGPCSIHDTDAALEYARWLKEMQVQWANELLLVMRTYVEKPRTRTGWKGLINDPALDGSFQINRGLREARQLLLDINAMHVPTAMEFVDVTTPLYLVDLVSWSAIGARTTESQPHRQMASGLPCPVGFKNSTDGNTKVAIDGVLAARTPHHFVSIAPSGRAAVVATVGNEAGHIILRGGTQPNYDAVSVHAAATAVRTAGICSQVMIDCGHGNSEGIDRQAVAVAQDIAIQLAATPTLETREIFGVMIESHLMAGCQRVVPGVPLVYGQSITDACLGLDDTAHVLDILRRSTTRMRRG